jgi:hypothetical protein
VCVPGFDRAHQVQLTSQSNFFERLCDSWPDLSNVFLFTHATQISKQHFCIVVPLVSRPLLTSVFWEEYCKGTLFK